VPDDQLPIIDCHQHFVDARRFRYPVFETRNPGFEALVGDYRALPSVYLPQDYARNTAGMNVVRTVWAEFMSDDPVGEVEWAADLTRDTGSPAGMIAVADFLSPDLERRLDTYQATGRVRCVRQHMGWHPTNKLLRYAPQPDLLSDPALRRGLAAAGRRGFVCEFEVFAPQLPDLASVIAACPDISFVLPAMGWPIDLSREGRAAWKRDLTALASHPNVAIKIFGMECIFGVNWTVPQVRPWILDTIGLFGPDRCMFASHMPICTLACSFRQLYDSYFEVIAGFSIPDQRRILHDTAARVYGV
jgi:predicted TIM-barrel fold metal-dependent hydrolase